MLTFWDRRQRAAAAATAGILLLLTVLAASPLATNASEQQLQVSGEHYRNQETKPHTIEMPFDASWQFACMWSRRYANETPILAIEVPGQSQRNCQFSTSSGPAVCTPSYVEFSSGATSQKSNLTCSESPSDRLLLTCSISVQGFNPRHIGVWSCKNLTDNRNESIFLQYFKNLPQSGLVLASWDPVGPTNGTTENSTNRFECFTNIAVVPPARLTYILGGVVLTKSAKYPVEWLTDTMYTVQPVKYQINSSVAFTTASPAPSGGLNLNQRMLASSRILEMRLLPSYNGLILQCVAYQGLSTAHLTAEHRIVLHLDDTGSSVSLDPRASSCLLMMLAWWLAAARCHSWLGC